MSVSIIGIPSLFAKLDALRRSVRTRILRKAVRAAVKPVRQTIKAFAPIGKTGALRRSVTSKIARQKGDTSLGIAGHKRRYSDTVKPTKYAHLVERGRRPKRTLMASFTLNGKRVRISRQTYRGSQANPYMQRAKDASGGAAILAFTAKLTEELHKQAAATKPSEVDDGN